jgi:hypothetical protein
VAAELLSVVERKKKGEEWRKSAVYIARNSGRTRQHSFPKGVEKGVVKGVVKGDVKGVVKGGGLFVPSEIPTYLIVGIIR